MTSESLTELSPEQLELSACVNVVLTGLFLIMTGNVKCSFGHRPALPDVQYNPFLQSIDCELHFIRRLHGTLEHADRSDCVFYLK